MHNFRRNAVLICLCLLLLIDSIGGGLIFPLMPTLFLDAKLGLLPHASLEYRNLLYGLSFAVFPLAAIFGMPILGGLSDVIGRKKTLLFSLVVIVISYFFSWVAVLEQMEWLFIFARILIGFASGSVSAVNAALVDISLDDKDKINNFKYITLASILGFIMGPGLSVVVPQVQSASSIILPFKITFVLGVLNLGLLICLFPKNIAQKKQKLSGDFGQHILESILFSFKLPNLRLILTAYFCFQLGLGLIIQMLPMYLSLRYAFLPGQIGGFFLVMGVNLCLSMFILHPWIAKRFSEQIQVKRGLFILTVVLLSLTVNSVFDTSAHFKSMLAVWLLFSVFYFAMPFITLNMSKFFSGLVTKEQQGRIMGGVGIISSAAMVVSALVIGVLASRSVFLIMGLAAVAILASLIIISRVFRHLQLDSAQA